jgi:stage V sporulation protein G
MEVTEVRVFPVDEDRLKAYATITFDSCFLVRDLKVIMGNKGLFVAMPSKKRKDGTYQDTAHPLNRETRKMIEDHVLGEYFRLTGGTQAAKEPASEQKEEETA